jgi:hypothetical protein
MEDIIHQVIQNSPIAAVALLAAWWFKQGGEATASELRLERKERLNAMEDELKFLRHKSDKCEDDRLQMHKDLSILKNAAGMKFSLVEMCKEGD